MFFDKDLLTKRKQGLTIAWLAATVGPKASFGKKLNKREVLDCDLENVCFKISEPEEPLALRLSASLLLGVARLYGRQVAFFASDVERVSDALQGMLRNLSKGSTLDINMSEPGTRASRRRNVIRQDDTNESFDMAEQFMAAEDFAWAMFNDCLARGPLPTVDDSGIDTSQQIFDIDDHQRFSQDGKTRKGKPPARAKHTLDDAELKLPDVEEDLLPQMDLSQDFAQLDEDGRAGDNYMFPDEAAAEAEQAGFDLGLDLDLGQLAPDAQDQAANDFEAGAGDGGADFDVRMAGGPFDDDSPPGSFDAARPQGNEGSPGLPSKERSSNSTASKPRSRKPKAQVIDSKLSLSRDEMEANRRSYSATVLAQFRQKGRAKRNRDDRDLANAFFYGPPEQLRDVPHLADFWTVEIISMRKRAFDDDQDLYSAKRARTGALAVEEDEIPEPELGRGNAAPRASDMGPSELQPAEYAADGGFDFEAGADFGNDMEFGRDAGTPRSARAGSVLQSQSVGKSPAMPWNLSDFAFEAYGHAAERASSAGNRSRRLSFRSESPISRRTSLAGSVGRASRRGSRAASVADASVGQVTGLGDSLSRSVDEAELSQGQLQRECLNFLTYAKSKADVHGELYFDDLAPRADTSASVAAQAFHHVLVLASGSTLKILGQDEPYGTIRLGL